MLNFIRKDTVFYIVAPAKLATGGAELLHQLASKLKIDGRLVNMLYVPSARDPVHANYKIFNIPIVTDVEDEAKNVLIVPEVHTKLLFKYKYIKKIVWWLSIDFYFHSMNRVKGRINRFILNKLGVQKYYFFEERLKLIDAHLVQSEYAFDVLRFHQVEKIYRLSDCLDDSFLSADIDLKKKNDIVVFNPKKGQKFTSKIIKQFDKFTFVAIEKMSREDVIELLKISKVYIDFGFHPGKDRLPREAAYLKNCIITNTRGSAKYNADVPIPLDFKFDEKTKHLKDIKNKVEDCLLNYDENLVRFESYRDEISKQEQQFDLEISSLFRN